jgi:hypothetical protein
MCKTCGCTNCQCWKTGDGDRTQLKGLETPEHTKIISRTRGVQLEIAVGPHGTSDKKEDVGGLVSKNPFASLAQEGFLHAHPEKLGKAGLKEWDQATKGKSLPKRVKK